MLDHFKKAYWDAVKTTWEIYWLKSRSQETVGNKVIIIIKTPEVVLLCTLYIIRAFALLWQKEKALKYNTVLLFVNTRSSSGVDKLRLSDFMSLVCGTISCSILYAKRLA